MSYYLIPFKFPLSIIFDSRGGGGEKARERRWEFCNEMFVSLKGGEIRDEGGGRKLKGVEIRRKLKGKG